MMWDSNAVVNSLEALFVQGIGVESELFMMDGLSVDEAAKCRAERSLSRRIQELELYLDESNRDGYFALLGQMTDLNDGDRSKSGLAMEVYDSVVAMLIAYMNRWRMITEMGESINSRIPMGMATRCIRLRYRWTAA